MDVRLTVKQAAQRLGVPERTVLHWVHQGRVTAERFGDVWAIPAAEVDRLAAEGRPPLGLPKGTKLSRRYQGTCTECGREFQSARPAKYCSATCSARHRARERRLKQGREGSAGSLTSTGSTTSPTSPTSAGPAPEGPGPA
jgi:excisionase family DNA binding protein